MNDLSDIFKAIGTNAADLLLTFFGGYVPSTAERAGTKRRVKREDAQRVKVEALYADMPALPMSRQFRRQHERGAAKLTAHKRNKARKHGEPRWNWRDVLAEAKGAEA